MYIVKVVPKSPSQPFMFVDPSSQLTARRKDSRQWSRRDDAQSVAIMWALKNQGSVEVERA